MRCLLLSYVTLSLALISSGSVFAQGEKTDTYMAAPTVEAPKAGSVAGDYARYVIGEGSLARGSFQVKLNISLDEKAGALGHPFLPVYTPESPLTEWGMGWASSLDIKRVNFHSEVNYKTDDLSTPWGRVILGDDGLWHGASAQTRVRVEVQKNNIIVRDADGKTFYFGGDLAGAGRVPGEFFSWSLYKVVDKLGDETIYTYEKNTSGRLFLSKVEYGGQAGQFAYTALLNYETIARERQIDSFESGSRMVLDRRVSSVAFWSGVEEQQLRYSYKLTYDEAPLGPAFYLKKTQKRYQTPGAIEPPAVYTYDDAGDFLGQAKNEYIDKLDPIMKALGNKIISPRNVTLLDYNDDGLTDFEVGTARKLYIQNSDGFDVLDMTPVQGADPDCMTDVEGAKRPRLLTRLSGHNDAFHAVAAFPINSASDAKIKVCDIHGRLESEHTFEGAFYAGPKSRLADLDRDGRPEFILLQGQTLKIMKNTSDGEKITFTTAENQLLDEVAKVLTTIWLADVNGDGVADIVGKSKVGISVYFGLGGLRFQQDAKRFRLRKGADEFLDASNYDLSFLDINNDGLLDLILTQEQRYYLYTFRGDHYEPAGLPALAIRDADFGYPIMARFTDRGPYQLITPDGNGRALNIALSRASAGMLTSFNDGKGNNVDLSYAYTKPEVNMRWQRPLLVEKRTTTVGKGSIDSQYTYTDPLQHSGLKSFLAFGTAKTTAKPFERRSEFTANDQFEVLQTKQIDLDKLSGLKQIDATTYMPVKAHGIVTHVIQTLSSRIEDASGSALTLSKQVYEDYDDHSCAKKVITKNLAGQIVVEKAFSNDDLFADGLACLPVTEKTTGTHQMTELNFTHTKETTYNAQGLPTKVMFGAETADHLLATYQYDERSRLRKVNTVDDGATTLSYQGSTRILASVKDFNSVEHKAESKLDNFLPKSISTIRDGSVFTTSFGFDPFERLAKVWSSDYGSFDKPIEDYSYTYGSDASLGRITTKSAVSAAASAKVTTLFAGDGNSLAELLEEEGKYKFKSLQRKDALNLKNQTLRRGPADINLISFDVDNIYEGAVVAASSSTDYAGNPLHNKQTIDEKAEKTEDFTYKVSGYGLEKTTLIAGRFSRSDVEWPGLGVVRSTDEAGNTSHFNRDALGRLRRVTFPSGQYASMSYDGLSRESVVRFSAVGIQKKTYEGSSKRIAKKEFLDMTGKLTSTVSNTYDQFHRLASATLHGDGQTIRYKYQYDGHGLVGLAAPVSQKGHLSTVESADFRKEVVYRLDGKVSEERLTVKGQSELTKIYSYGPSGVLLKETISVNAPGLAGIQYDKIYNYSADGALSGVSSSKANLFNITSDNLGAPHKLIFSGDSSWTRDVNELSRATVAVTASFPKFAFNLGMTYNDRGQIQSENFRSPQLSFDRGYDYDARGFLASEQSDSATLTYRYDTDGLPSLDRSEKLGYKVDTWGRVIQRGEYKYTYGPNGQIISAASKLGAVNAIYDESGERIALLKDGSVIAIFFKGLVVRLGSVSEVLRVRNDIVGILKNGAFEPVAVTTSGAALARTGAKAEMVDAYGGRSSQQDQTLSELDFGGHRRDSELGLVRMGIRDYSPELGRFVTPDFYYFDHFDAVVGKMAEANLFSYAANDPVNNIDADGRNAYVLLNSEGTSHVAILIGDAKAGYDYFSMGMQGQGTPVEQLFAALVGSNPAGIDHQFFSSNPSETLRGWGYDKVFEIPTSPGQDVAMKTYAFAEMSVESKYHLIFNNCAIFVMEALRRGDIRDTENMSNFIPSSMFDKYKNSYEALKTEDPSYPVRRM